MIIILTQCFPPGLGGIENLVKNLSIELSNNHEVLVLADQRNKLKDTLYDVKNKNNFLINRIGGLKFLRRREKLSELKKYLHTKKVSCIIGDSWKSFELSIYIISDLSITSICLVHGNEIITKNSHHNEESNFYSEQNFSYLV
jgi:hypothetical protein